MANKKNKNYKISFIKDLWRHRFVRVIAIIIGVVVILGITDAAIKALKLSSSGRKLNEIQAQIQDSGIDVSLYRDKYCWRTQEKLSNGIRICAQRLVLVGQDKPLPTQKTESKQLLNLIEEVFSEKIYSGEFSEYGEGGVVIASAAIKGPPTASGCLVDYRAYDKLANDTSALTSNKYIIDVSCSEYIPMLGVYPYRGHGNPGWELYVEPYRGD